MRESMITTILSAICGILLIGAVVGICSQDRTAPTIRLNGKNTLTYTEGDSYDLLLKGMVAEDDVDGDVTDTIRISNIHIMDDGKAMVVYVAKDSSNNIGKIKRKIQYQKKEIVVDLEEIQGMTIEGEGQVLPGSAGITNVTGR